MLKVRLMKFKQETHIRSIVKSVIWRAWGVLFLAFITYIFTHNWITTALITILHHSIFILAYYLHERFWLQVSWLRNSRLKPFMRIITYEMILANLVLGVISYAFTGNLMTMTTITLTYVCNKYWMYYAYDYLWSKIRWKAVKRVTVYTYACTDLLHRGHLRAFQQAKKLGDYLIVGILTDKAIRSYKGQPIIPFEERIELVANLKCVDEVVKQDNVDPTQNLKKLDVDILTHGDDWGNDFPGSQYMRSIGKKAIGTKYYPYQSTTKIKEKIVKKFEKGMGIPLIYK